MTANTSTPFFFFDDPKEALRHSFSMDREYCSFLLKSPASDVALRLLFLSNQASFIISFVQKGLQEAVERRFSREDREAAAFYTQALTIGMWQDARLIGYFVLRGLTMECFAAIRRALEDLGVLAHIWHAPEKVRVLGNDGDADPYRDAFVSRKASAGHGRADRAVRPRFACLQGGREISRLYALFSEFGVHGGSAKRVLDYPGEDARLSCPFVTRSIDVELPPRLELFSSAILVVCQELAVLLQKISPDSPYTICSVHNLANLLNPNYVTRELATLKAQLGIDKNPLFEDGPPQRLP
jgi:hypothetical protein